MLIILVDVEKMRLIGNDGGFKSVTKIYRCNFNAMPGVQGGLEGVGFQVQYGVC